MKIDEIRAALIGKRLQTLYHGKVQIEWGEIEYVEHINLDNSYRLSLVDDHCGHYLDAETIETLCRNGIAEKRNEWGKHYKLVEIEESLK